MPRAVGNRQARAFTDDQNHRLGSKCLADVVAQRHAGLGCDHWGSEGVVQAQGVDECLEQSAPVLAERTRRQSVGQHDGEVGAGVGQVRQVGGRPPAIRSPQVLAARAGLALDMQCRLDVEITDLPRQVGDVEWLVHGVAGRCMVRLELEDPARGE